MKKRNIKGSKKLNHDDMCSLEGGAGRDGCPGLFKGLSAFGGPADPQPNDNSEPKWLGYA